CLSYEQAGRLHHKKSRRCAARPAEAGHSERPRTIPARCRMTHPAAPGRPARLAADLARPLPLSDAARALLAPAHTARQFFEALAAQPALTEDAIRFLAVALPKREAVSWALACVRAAIPKPAPEAAKAAAAVEAWVKEPSEANRRACGAAAEA